MVLCESRCFTPHVALLHWSLREAASSKQAVRASLVLMRMGALTVCGVEEAALWIWMSKDNGVSRRRGSEEGGERVCENRWRWCW